MFEFYLLYRVVMDPRPVITMTFFTSVLLLFLIWYSISFPFFHLTSPFASDLAGWGGLALTDNPISVMHSGHSIHSLPHSPSPQYTPTFDIQGFGCLSPILSLYYTHLSPDSFRSHDHIYRWVIFLYNIEGSFTVTILKSTFKPFFRGKLWISLLNLTAENQS